MSEDDNLSPAAVRVSSRRKRNSTLSRRSAWQKSSWTAYRFCPAIDWTAWSRPPT